MFALTTPKRFGSSSMSGNAPGDFSELRLDHGLSRNLALAGFFAFVVLYEEPTLCRKFCKEYEEFCVHVPRWILLQTVCASALTLTRNYQRGRNFLIHSVCDREEASARRRLPGR